LIFLREIDYYVKTHRKCIHNDKEILLRLTDDDGGFSEFATVLPILNTDSGNLLRSELRPLLRRPAGTSICSTLSVVGLSR
jgi:hypothetical protein